MRVEYWQCQRKGTDAHWRPNEGPLLAAAFHVFQSSRDSK